MPLENGQDLDAPTADAVDDAIGSLEDLTHVVPTHLGNEPSGERIACRVESCRKKLVNPPFGRPEVVLGYEVSDCLEIGKSRSVQKTADALRSCSRDADRRRVAVTATGSRIAPGIASRPRRAGVRARHRHRQAPRQLRRRTGPAR